jgi:hypothetical protein
VTGGRLRGASIHSLPAQLDLIEVSGQRLVEQLIVTPVSQARCRFGPSCSRRRRALNLDPGRDDPQLDLFPEPHLFNEWLGNANAARVADPYDLRFHQWNASPVM